MRWREADGDRAARVPVSLLILMTVNALSMAALAGSLAFRERPLPQLNDIPMETPLAARQSRDGQPTEPPPKKTDHQLLLEVVETLQNVTSHLNDTSRQLYNTQDNLRQLRNRLNQIEESKPIFDWIATATAFILCIQAGVTLAMSVFARWRWSRTGALAR